jgi:hypothetical protein
MMRFAGKTRFSGARPKIRDYAFDKLSGFYPQMAQIIADKNK